MKCDLTIILLLKDRHNFNERFLNYYIKNNINFKLIISDGGKKKLSKNAIILKNITPKIPYSENVPSVLNFKKYLLKM